MGAAGFAYYLPDYRLNVTEDVAREHGLAYAIDFPPTMCQTSQGPDGRSGCIFGRESVMAGNFKDAHWEAIDTGKAWVCMVGLPGPADLARPDARIVGGKFVELGQHKWLCPTARKWLHDGKDVKCSTELPHGLTHREGHWYRGDVVPEYRQLLTDALAWFRIRCARADDDERESFDIFSAAARALQTNYLLDVTEISSLGIFDERSPVRILDVLMDLDGLEELQKKGLLLVQSPSGDGSTVSPPSTNPQLQTCG